MKKIVIVAISFLFAGTAFSQASYLKKRAQGGDPGLDSSLTQIDKDASADVPKFKKDLNTQYNVGEPKLEQMFKKMPPADAYMACEVSKQSGKPIDEVVKSYDKNKEKGWGEIAKEMGIKPGSPEFHALKSSAKGKSHGHGHDHDHGHGNENHEHNGPHDHGNGHEKGKGKK